MMMPEKSPQRPLPPVVSIVSKKGAGKTTLIEKLIPALKQRGYRVGAIKHDTHGFDIDHEGKDTWRIKKAGAEAVAISSPWKISLIRDVEAEMSLEALIAEFFTGVDIVLTEGYKRAGKPQVEVFRRQAHQRPLYADEAQTDPLIAIMSDAPIALGVPRFDLDDIAGLADFIENRFL